MHWMSKENDGKGIKRGEENCLWLCPGVTERLEGNLCKLIIMSKYLHLSFPWRH